MLISLPDGAVNVMLNVTCSQGLPYESLFQFIVFSNMPYLGTRVESEPGVFSKVGVAVMDLGVSVGDAVEGKAVNGAADGLPGDIFEGLHAVNANIMTTMITSMLFFIIFSNTLLLV